MWGRNFSFNDVLFGSTYAAAWATILLCAISFISTSLLAVKIMSKKAVKLKLDRKNIYEKIHLFEVHWPSILNMIYGFS